MTCLLITVSLQLLLLFWPFRWIANGLVGDDLSFGDGLRLDSIKQFCQNWFDMFADIAGNDEKKEVFSRLKLSAFGLDNNIKNAVPLEKFLANGLYFGKIRGDLQCLDLALVLSRPVPHHAVVDEDHPHIVLESRLFFHFCNSFGDVHGWFLVLRQADG